MPPLSGNFARPMMADPDFLFLIFYAAIISESILCALRARPMQPASWSSACWPPCSSFWPNATTPKSSSSSASSAWSTPQLWHSSASSKDGRTFTNSQVLAFNVSNFVAVMFLKALLVALGLATGFSGFGLYTARRTDPPHEFAAFQYHPRRPSSHPAYEPPEDHGHIRWATTYLSSLNTGDYRCLKRIACEQPERARFYAGLKDTIVAALRMVPCVTEKFSRCQLAQLLNSFSTETLCSFWFFFFSRMYSQNPDHDKITAAVRSAAQIGTRYHQLCRIKFPCKSL
nr:uncharacterized protein LOC119168199 [Rhipicephalus microplus]